MLRGYSSVGRAPALQAGGLEFESLYLHKSRNSNRCSDLFCGDKTPQSSCDSPGLVTAPVGRWEPDSPDPLGRYARYAHVFFNPQSLRDSPGGALGTVFPRPLESLRALCARFFSTPQSLRDSPVGHWEPDSPAPLGRYARYAHVFFNPQSLRDSPGGALGTVFPRPLGSLRSEWCDYERKISTSPSRPILMIWEARPVAPASRRGSTV